MNKANKRDYFDWVELGISSLIAMFMLIEQRVIVYLLTALFVNLIVSGFVKGFALPKKQFFPFIGFFAIYFIGLLFTDNMNEGWSDIETKMSFLVMPLFYGVRKRKKPIELTWLIWPFVAGSIYYLSICLYGAYECFELEKSRFCFESVRLSRGVHPTYLALYLIAGSFLIVYDIVENKKGRWLKFSLGLPVVLFYFYFIYKLYSLGPWMGFFGMIATLTFAYFYWIKRLLVFGIGVVVFIGVGFFVVQKLDLLRSDYNTVKMELAAYFEDEESYIENNQNNINSVPARILLWNSSIDFIQSNPMGVGTGDVSDELSAYYLDKGMVAFAEKNLNPHSQYLQTAVALGILGGLYLLAVMIYYFYLGFKYRNYLMLALIGLFASANLFESLFERQKGIVFFMFFLVIFVIQISHTEESKH